MRYLLYTLQRNTSIHCAVRIRSFSHPNFGAPCLCLGGCWFLAFITICVSLGVCCSAPPPGGTYTNEDTTSNEHPPPSVLNYSAVPLHEPTRHPESQQQNTPAETQAPQTSSSPRAEIEDPCPCPQCCAMFEGWSRAAVRVCVCVCVFV